MAVTGKKNKVKAGKRKPKIPKKIQYGKIYVIGGVPRRINNEEEYLKIQNKEKQKMMSLLMAELYQPGDVEIKIPKHFIF